MNKFRVDGDAAFLLIRSRNHPLECVVDLIDIPRLEEFGKTWSAMWNEAGRTFYVFCQKPAAEGRGPIYLHRWLMDTSDDMETHHIDHDGLNNRRSSNLCNVTKTVNQLHRRMQRNNTSGYRGVIYDRSRCLYEARVKANRKIMHLGRYATAQQANEVAARYRVEVLGLPA